MSIIKVSKFDGVFGMLPDRFSDKRGYFFESFNLKKFSNIIGNFNFIQENESMSKFRVLRGLHFQKPPYTQAKLIRVLDGTVLDIFVDIRTDSETFGKHDVLVLRDVDDIQLFIPRGFAHGFVALTENVKFQYKVDNEYSSEHDSGIVYNDSELNIDWEVFNPIISDKDLELDKFQDVQFYSSNEYFANPKG